MNAISETDQKEIRLGLTVKLKEVQEQIAKVEMALLEAKSEDDRGGNIVDVSSIFKLLKSFKSDFNKVDVSLQTEILKDIIHSIDVEERGVRIKIFGVTPGFSLESSSGGGLAVKRSAVRTVHKLVDPTGIEPVTSNMPC